MDNFTRLGVVRIINGLSQFEVAQLLGLSQPTVGAAERGFATPETMRRLGEAFGLEDPTTLLKAPSPDELRLACRAIFSRTDAAQVDVYEALTRFAVQRGMPIGFPRALRSKRASRAAYREQEEGA